MEKEIIETTKFVLDAGLVAIAVPMVIGLVAVVRYLIGFDSPLASRVSPFMSLVFGMGSYWLLAPDLTDYRTIIAGGIIVGLTSAGLFSGTRSVTESNAVKLAKKRAVENLS